MSKAPDAPAAPGEGEKEYDTFEDEDEFEEFEDQGQSTRSADRQRRHTQSTGRQAGTGESDASKTRLTQFVDSCVKSCVIRPEWDDKDDNGGDDAQWESGWAEQGESATHTDRQAAHRRQAMLLTHPWDRSLSLSLCVCVCVFHGQAGTMKISTTSSRSV